MRGSFLAERPENVEAESIDIEEEAEHEESKSQKERYQSHVAPDYFEFNSSKYLKNLICLVQFYNSLNMSIAVMNIFQTNKLDIQTKLK